MPSGFAHSPCRLAGFASAQAAPGQTVTVDIEVPRRAAQTWDPATQSWRDLPGDHRLRTGRSCADLSLDTTVARG
ncbi:fibronectin type III-like domain-contianing protein [Streptomyces diastatochromogenes]|uniref:fibronectin type III-like domain-contianing protein n=1 Tax=Streptomyces diastatochromogenes TaxID=42236 RepID=UPI00364E9F60